MGADGSFSDRDKAFPGHKGLDNGREKRAENQIFAHVEELVGCMPQNGKHAAGLALAMPVCVVVLMAVTVMMTVLMSMYVFMGMVMLVIASCRSAGESAHGIALDKTVNDQPMVAATIKASAIRE